MKKRVSPGAVPVPTPREFADVDVDYETGYRATAACGNPLSLPIPYDAYVPPKPGCGLTLRDWGERIKEWFQQ